MKIYIVRHGQTKENKKRIFQGHLPGTLSNLGIQQSKKVGIRLKDIDFDFVLSSDLKRAKETLKEILDKNPIKKIYFSKSLREKDYGIYSGRPRIKVSDEIAEREFESKEAVYKRAEKIVSKILKENAKNVLVIGHGSMNKYLITVLLKKDNAFRKQLPRMENGNISIINFSDKNNSNIEIFNDINHLKDL